MIRCIIIYISSVILLVFSITSHMIWFNKTCDLLFANNMCKLPTKNRIASYSKNTFFFLNTGNRCFWRKVMQMNSLRIVQKFKDAFVLNRNVYMNENFQLIFQFCFRFYFNCVIVQVWPNCAVPHLPTLSEGLLSHLVHRMYVFVLDYQVVNSYICVSMILQANQWTSTKSCLKMFTVLIVAYQCTSRVSGSRFPGTEQSFLAISLNVFLC